jgi:hypothetical protein
MGGISDMIDTDIDVVDEGTNNTTYILLLVVLVTFITATVAPTNY